MGDQLSQNQIDDLLKRLTTGEEQVPVVGKTVKTYDFNSPKKFTKEQLKILEDLHETFGRVVSNYFSSILRLFCEVSVLQIEEQLYFDFSSALPDNSLIGMLDIKPADKRFEEISVILNFSTHIGFFIIERLLGGLGKTDLPDRTFTDLETAILKDVFIKIASHMNRAWNNYVETEIEFSGLETNSRLMQSLAPKDIVVVVMMEIKVGETTGNIDLCIPASGLGEMINNMGNKYQKTSRRTLPDAELVKAKMMDNIVGSDLEIKAVLDELILDVQDVLHLQVNDIIPLNKPIDSDICVTVDGVPWFDGKLGEVRQKKAVKLNHLIAQDVNIEKRDFYGDR